MLQIEKNEEISKVLNRVKHNILDDYKYEYDEDKKVTEEKINRLKANYDRIRLNTPILWDISSVKDIPFNRDIDLTQCVREGKHLRHYKLRANTLVSMDYSKHDRYLEEYTEMGYYSRDLVLPQIMEDGQLWMCPTMMEYKTMKESIDNSHGNVLVFGCGIGFYQYMCLLRDEVKSITIVEINEGIIKNFKESILPQFNTTKEVTVIQGDAFDYFNNDFMKDYDYVFVDIWFNNTDGIEIYSKLLSHNPTHPEITYWIEDSFFLEVKRYIALYLFALYEGKLSRMLKVYPEDSTEKIVKCMHKLFRCYTDVIETEEEFLNFIHSPQIIKDILTLYGSTY